jgi:hypothetical protein
MSLSSRVVLALAVPALALLATASFGQQLTPRASAVVSQPKLQNWMSPELATAWSQGYRGQGTTMTIIDDFSSSSIFSGNFGLGTQTQRHGQWTSEEAGLVAPSAAIVSKDFNSGTAVQLRSGLNVLNMSYGMYARAGYNLNQIGWSGQESSIISYAKNGNAVISKAAGNDAVAVGSANSSGQLDYLDSALIGAKTAIFVGALNTNGTVYAPASLASYSNRAGSNATVQKQFLVVGVEGSKTGLYGTSFAAPVITGYAAVLGSKFTTASATQITNQLLSTARKDTLANYNVATYGAGEASLTRALAPVGIK